jgi:hypothetical protein
VDTKQYGRQDAAWTEVVANPTWSTLTGKPATFPPTVPIPWTDVSGKPATFPPTVPIAQADITGLVTDLGLKAPLASPVFTGNPTAPTPSTGDEDTSIATTAFVQTAVDSATGAGLFGYFDYTFNASNYTPPPIAGNFRMNNATQSAATHIYVHEQTATNNAATLMLAQIAVGDKLLIQTKADARKWQRYTVTAIADAGVYWDFTVTWVDGASALTSARTGIIVQKPAPEAVDWTDITGKPATFPPTLPIAQSGVTNLVTDLAAKEPTLPAGGTTSDFLRGDKTWAVPAGGGGGIAEPSSGNNLRQNGAWVPGVKLAGDTMTGRLVLPAATTALSPLNIPLGAGTPSSPVTGDIWLASAGVLQFSMSGTKTIATLQTAQSWSGLQTFQARITAMTPTAASASIRLPHGVTPTSPTPSDGDMWTTTAAVFARINGVTKTIATNITVASTAPSSPAVNDVWIDTT